MKKKVAIVFAGVPGVSKTSIATYVSCEFNLPIFSTDQIRFEVREDLRLDDINKPGGVEEFKKRYSERFARLLASGESFIRDGSVDRSWQDIKDELTSAGYEWFLIHIELSESFLRKLYEETGRKWWADDMLTHYLKEHETFAKTFDSDTTIRITDKDFPNRMSVVAKALSDWL